MTGYSPWQRARDLCLLLLVLSIALWLPYRVFGAWPFEGRETVTAAHMSRLLAGLDLPDYYAQRRPQPSPAELAVQQAEFTWCRFCHTLGAGEPHRVGPNLNRILGKPAAVGTGFAYSSAFVRARERGLVWTPETLESFIADPHGYVPENRMRYEPVVDAAARQRIIDYLWLHSR